MAHKQPARQLVIKSPITGVSVHVHASITEARIVEALDRQLTQLEDPGFCVNCGAEASNVEPDARAYKCSACDYFGVYGAEELLFLFV